MVQETRTMPPYTCQHATFDGGADDPRTLVYRYQQELRGRLLAQAYAEARRPRWSACALALIHFVRAAFTQRTRTGAMAAA
jgi:hypothetical protein